MVAYGRKMLGTAKCLETVYCVTISWVKQTFSSALRDTKTLEASPASPYLPHTSEQQKYEVSQQGNQSCESQTQQ